MVRSSTLGIMNEGKQQVRGEGGVRGIKVDFFHLALGQHALHCHDWCLRKPDPVAQAGWCTQNAVGLWWGPMECMHWILAPAGIH